VDFHHKNRAFCGRITLCMEKTPVWMKILASKRLLSYPKATHREITIY
jgi:hypothetical protein